MWFFNSPHIVFGEDALSWLAQFTGRRAFIVTDTTMVKLGFSRRVEEQLSQAGIQTYLFDQVEPDPCVETVQRCAQAMTQYAPDWVIGLGGGSCLDTAKAAWFLYERPDVELEAINPVQDFGLRQKARLITIPTTAGSGAEATSAAVIKEPRTCRKLELACNELIADYAIVDPIFSAKMPRTLTADTGIDVLAHAIEAYTSTWANDFTDGLCLQAARLAYNFLPGAVENGLQDEKAREKMANAATLAGMALCNSQIGLAHAMGHSAGSAFGLPHGRVTGLCLPYTIEFSAASCAGRYLDLARFLELPVQNESQASTILVQALRGLMVSFGLPLSLQAAGVSQRAFDESLDSLCENASLDIGLVTHPRVPSQDELRQLFIDVYA